MLRTELAEGRGKYALSKSLPHCLSYGEQSVVCFEAFGERRHGNFHPDKLPEHLCSSRMEVAA